VVKKRVSVVKELVALKESVEALRRRMAQAEITGEAAVRGSIEGDATLTQLRRNLIRLARGDVPADWHTGIGGIE
jgi:hypothetical protein